MCAQGAIGLPWGLILLFGVAALIFFGVAHRVLDRIRLTDGQALIAIALMIGGTFIDIPILTRPNRISINLGGALVPGFLAVYLWIRSDSAKEKIRSLLAALATAIVIWLVAQLVHFGPEGGGALLDPLWLFSLVAGVTGYLAGRSRRAAFIAGVIGVLAVDVAHAVWAVTTRSAATVMIGGAGIFDAIVLSGLIAVALAELVGETRERLAGGPELGPDRPKALRQDEGVPEDEGPAKGSSPGGDARE